MVLDRREALMKVGLSGLIEARAAPALPGERDVAGLSYSAPFKNAVARSLNERLSDVISVTDFGAEGDGIADDTKAFQNGADAAANLGKALFIPAPRRSYLITDTIEVRCRRFFGDVSHIDSSNRGTLIIFRPKTLSDMKPCFAVVGGMYGTGLVENLTVWGTESFNRGRPGDWVDPMQLPSYSAFVAGVCAFGVYGGNMPTFRNVATAAVKVGLYLDSTDGHVSCYDCNWNGVFGVYCHRNSEDYFFVGGGITGVFTGVAFGTFNHANHAGGMHVTMYRVHMGFSPYGFYQLMDAEFRGPAASLYGRLDGVRFEQIGEAAFNFLSESVTDALYVDNFGFSWSPVHRGYPDAPNAWITNLPPEILPYDEQQQFALRMGAVGGDVKLGWLGGPWPLRRSPNAKDARGIALIDRIETGDHADLSALGGDVVVKNPATPNSWTRRRAGPPATRMDLTLDADVSPAVNMLENPEIPSNWIRRGVDFELTVAALGDTGRLAPRTLLEELGTEPVVIKITPRQTGGSHMALPFAKTGRRIGGRAVCLTFWVCGSRMRARYAMDHDQYLYDTTYEAARDWVKVVCVDQTSGEVAPRELHVFSEGASPYFICGVMACLDSPKPYTPLAVPRVRRGLALEDAAIAPAASVAGTASVLPPAPAGYLAVKINGVDRHIAFY